MKYKLYFISDQNHPYFKEIRGIRFEYQYHLLSDNSTYLPVEYEDRDTPPPELFFNINGNPSNLAKFRVKETFIDYFEISKEELEKSLNYIQLVKSNLLKDCYFKRQNEYGSVQEQLDLIYHSGLDGWKSHIALVKLKYPKPN